MAAARIHRRSARLVEPTCGWQRGLELLMNGTCPWCFKPIEAFGTGTPRDIGGQPTPPPSSGAGMLTWICEGECNR